MLPAPNPGRGNVWVWIGGMAFLKKTAFGVLLWLGLSAMAPAMAATVTIANAGFENGTTGRPNGFTFGQKFSQLPGSFIGWDTYNGLQGWTVSGGGGNRVEVHSNSIWGTDPHTGDYAVSLDAGTGKNSTITQAVSIAAGTYFLSFWYSPESAWGPTNAVTYNLGKVVNGQVTHGTAGARVGIWTEIKVRFSVASATTMNLSFGASGAADGTGGLIDDVSIVATVPAPAAGLLLLGGLGLLAGLRRRRYGCRPV